MRICSFAVLAALCAIAVAVPEAQAQSPIPESRVPAFGGSSPGTVSSSPSAVGTDVGTNVGAGGNAGPSNEIVTPANRPNSDGIKPLPGTSGGVTITR